MAEMAAKGGRSGLATQMAQEAAERVRGAASWLDRREPGDLLDGVRDFARRHPGQFLVGAAVAGVVAESFTSTMMFGYCPPAVGVPEITP